MKHECQRYTPILPSPGGCIKMPRRPAVRNRQEILNRSIRIDSVGLRVSRRAEKPRGGESRFEDGSWLELRGDAEEPLSDVRRFTILLTLDDREEPGTSNPPSIGAILRLKPEVDAAVSLGRASFDRVWSLATTNLLRYCWLAFMQPYRGSSLIVSASFSSELEE